MSDSITNIYLDTWLLRGLVSENAAEKADANHHMNKLRSNVFNISVPQIALGEVFAVIMRDFRSDPIVAYTKLKKLFDDLMGILDVDACLPPPTVKSLQYARELKEGDNNLRETDLLIVAQALADPDSQRLLTPDKDLLDSRIIKEKEKQLRFSGERNVLLKIVDGL